MSSVSLLTSLTGGICLGAASAVRLAITGRITGISGIYGGLIRGDISMWRVMFVLGMVAGGAYMAAYMPQTLLVIPQTFPVSRAALAGALVGFGTSLGSGCTSGHGVCGLARLSKRSFVAVLTFMSVGAVVATVTNTAAALGGTPPLWPKSIVGPQLGLAGSTAAAALTTLCGMIAISKAAPNHIVSLLTDFVCGAVFAVGLGIGGMLQPAKVAAFLTPLSPLFDPSLMAVMGGALLVTMPTFQFFMRGNKRAACGELCLPTTTAIDWKLLTGAALFGAGWGLGGMCPGPALASLAAPSPQSLALVATMSLAMILQPWATEKADKSLSESMMA